MTYDIFNSNLNINEIENELSYWDARLDETNDELKIYNEDFTDTVIRLALKENVIKELVKFNEDMIDIKLNIDLCLLNIDLWSFGRQYYEHGHINLPTNMLIPITYIINDIRLINDVIDNRLMLKQQLIYEEQEQYRKLRMQQKQQEFQKKKWKIRQERHEIALQEQQNKKFKEQQKCREKKIYMRQKSQIYRLQLRQKRQEQQTKKQQERVRRM